MKTRSLSLVVLTLPALALLLTLPLAARAQDPFAAPDNSEEKPAEAEAPAPALPKPKGPPQIIKEWGVVTDPAGDCKVKAESGKLTITVPGSVKAHDLAAENNNLTAPRVLTALSGDFTIQVKVEGEFEPGGESTQEGRIGYTGAGLAVFADAKNYVTIARATIQSQDDTESRPYTNFEIRVDGKLERFGDAADFKTEADKPTWLRLSRKGDTITGSMSQDGVNWTSGEPKTLTAAAWQKQSVLGGVAAVSTSTKNFAPVFSGFTAGKPVEDPNAPKEKPAAPAKEEFKDQTVKGKATKLGAWGTTMDPAGDCTIKTEQDGARLTIALPAGSEVAHNLCVEQDNMKAPRILQDMKGDFDLQVKVDGTFEPTEEHGTGSRIAYLGAGLCILADEENYIRFERSTRRFAESDPTHYTNFEIRVAGQPERLGSPADFPTEPGKPLWLRLERRGETVRGGMSHDGKEWSWGEPKKLDDPAWGVESVKAGIHAISSSMDKFEPFYTDFSCSAAKAEAEAEAEKK